MLKGIGWQESVACLINIAGSCHRTCSCHSTYSPLDLIFFSHVYTKSEVNQHCVYESQDTDAPIYDLRYRMV